MERLQESKIYNRLADLNSGFIPKINEAYEHANNALQKVNSIFDNYTEHGIDHSLRVLGYMTDLISDINTLSELELTLIIYSAIFHDIGMLVDDNDKSELISGLGHVNESEMSYSVILSECRNDEKRALQEYYRPLHGKRAGKYLEKMSRQDFFCIPQMSGVSFLVELSEICRSHTESSSWIQTNLKKKTYKGDYEVNSQYIATLLRLGDILDIDEQRTPDYIYKLFRLSEYGELEWKQHFIIDNTRKIFVDSSTGQKYIEFHGSSNEPDVHRKLLSYIDWINTELEAASKLCSNFIEDKYGFFIKEKVVNKIDTKGFNISDFRLTLDYKAVTGLLMGEKIYGDKRYGLRELLQNSVDACKIMKEIYMPKFNKTGEEYKPYITILLDKDDGKIKVRDNGVGMTIDILRKYFLNVGVSYYSSTEFKYRGYKYKPIGNFGIGFLACFMLSDKVRVTTKHYTETQTNEIEIEKSSEFISLTCKEETRQHGTEVTLDYESFLRTFNNSSANVKSFIEDNFLMDGIDIKIIEIEQGESKQIVCKSKPEINEKFVNLSPYLNGIEAYMAVKMIDEDVKTLEELTNGDSDQIYVYDETRDELVSYEDSDINEFIEDDKICYLQIPIIDSSLAEKFEKLESALENWDEAYDKIADDIDNFIYIFSKNFNQSQYTEGRVDINDNIIGNYSYSRFCSEFGANRHSGTKIEIVEKIVSHKDRLKSVLPIDLNESIGFNQTIYFNWRYSNGKEIDQKIYNKNVYLPKMQIVIPYIANLMSINATVINLCHKGIVPNLARDNIDEKKQTDKLGYAIGKAIHQYFYVEGQLSGENCELMDALLKKYYAESNEFLFSEKMN